MSAILGRTGTLVGFTTGRGTTPWDTDMEASLRRTDAMLGSTVIAITNTLPASANEGDLYLIGTLPTGVAAGWANRIARWRGSPAQWEAYQPLQGWIVTILAESSDRIRRYNGSGWASIGADISMSSIDGLTAAIAGKLNTNDPVATGTFTVPEIKFSEAGVGVGILRWSATEHVPEVVLENGSVLQVGKETLQWCRNSTGTTIQNGQLVIVNGSTGDNPTLALANASSLSTSDTIGMATQSIPDGQEGFVAVGISFVRGLVTTGSPAGTPLYLATTNGAYTATAPAKPGRKVRIGFVLREHASAGIILLWIHNYHSASDINDIDTTGAVTDDVLRRNSSGVWVPGKALQVNDPTFTGTLTGPAAVFGSGTGTAAPSLSLNCATGQTSIIHHAVAGVNRWSEQLYLADTYRWVARDAAGATIDFPLQMSTLSGGEMIWGGSTLRSNRFLGDVRFDDELRQGTNLRITSGGEGRFAGLRVTGIATGAMLKIADANGQLAAAVANTDFLAANNPTYTGRLTGHTQYLEADEQIHLAIRRPGGNSGRIHGVAFQAQNDASAWVEFGRVTTYISSVTAGAHTGGMRLMAYKDGAILQALEAGPDGVRVGSGLPLQMGTTTVIDSSRNGSFADLSFSGSLNQGATQRITAGGEGRFVGLRSTDLVSSDRNTVYVDGNGQLVKSNLLRLDPILGPIFTSKLQLAPAFYNGTSGYLQASLSMRPDAVDESNSPLGLDSGDIWNSKRTNSIGITDGALGSPYIGKLKADRWVGTSDVSISGTTSATSWFAAGTGEGSATLPANYLRQGRRGTVKGTIVSLSASANTSPTLVLKFGSISIPALNRSFTIGPGNYVRVSFECDFYIDSNGWINFIGEARFYSTAGGVYYLVPFTHAEAYNGTTSTLIDATIQPSSSSETWIRALAVVEI